VQYSTRIEALCADYESWIEAVTER
jgi:hypothetical protein